MFGQDVCDNPWVIDCKDKTLEECVKLGYGISDEWLIDVEELELDKCTTIVFEHVDNLYLTINNFKEEN